MTNYNQIIEGDCISVLKTLPDACVNLVITDPPYGVNYRERKGRTIANDGNLGNILGAFTDLYRVLTNDSLCISFYGWPRIDEFSQAWREAGFRPVGHIVWHKSYASISRMLEGRHEAAYVLAKGKPSLPAKPLADVQPWAYTGNKFHPTEKAVSILTPLVKCFTQPGDVVLDPFSGSGSTSVAAALSGRRYIGIELEHKYCEIARRRLAGVNCWKERQAG